MAHNSLATARVQHKPDRHDASGRRFDRVNIAVLAAQLTAWAACLGTLSRTDNTVLALLILVFFCLMMQGVFSMMHETFHDHGHRSARINYLMSWLASTLFGASATLIRINHLGHHVRNRTRAELVDYVEADESRLKKTIAYYAGISGGIWIGAFLLGLFLLLMPSAWIQRLQSRGANNTYAAALADFSAADFRRIRIEVVAGITFWIVAWLLLSLEPLAVGMAYLAFAVSWSSLQWIYHVRTPLDVVEGAYNLRASLPIRCLFLNFNYNLTHHRDSSIRWQQLHAASDLRETRPFWRGWLAIVLPPQPMPPDRLIPKTYY